jgi:hypothetical protein
MERHPDHPDPRRIRLRAGLVALLFSKQLYVSSPSSYYIFYLIDRFDVSTQASSICSSSRRQCGGCLLRRAARRSLRPQIRHLVLDPGALPFTLALPYAGLAGSAVLTVFIGLILSSATSSIIVFAQELMPHRFGMISGVFFGVAFGIGGLGAAVLASSPTTASLSSIMSALPAGDRPARRVPAEDAALRALRRLRSDRRRIKTLLTLQRRRCFQCCKCIAGRVRFQNRQRLSTLKLGLSGAKHFVRSSVCEFQT